MRTPGLQGLLVTLSFLLVCSTEVTAFAKLSLGFGGRVTQDRHSHRCAQQYVEIAEAAFFTSEDAVYAALETLATLRPKGTWLQIGSNTLDGAKDGGNNHNDPFLKKLAEFPDYDKFFVEPIPHLYNLLKDNIAQIPNAQAINVALLPSSERAEEKVSMYCVPFDKLTDISYSNQICSFNPTHVSKHFADVKAAEVEVTGLSMEELLRRYAITDIRVLMIDTEGFDFTVLKQLPFHDPNFRPNVLVYEHRHLSDNDKAAAQALLRAQCYMVFAEPDENTFCCCSLIKGCKFGYD